LKDVVSWGACARFYLREHGVQRQLDVFTAMPILSLHNM